MPFSRRSRINLTSLIPCVMNRTLKSYIIVTGRCSSSSKNQNLKSGQSSCSWRKNPLAFVMLDSLAEHQRYEYDQYDQSVSSPDLSATRHPSAAPPSPHQKNRHRLDSRHDRLAGLPFGGRL